MLNAKETKAVITQTFDDDSSSDLTVKAITDEKTPMVVLIQGENVINIYEDSWPLIKDKIMKFFRDMEEQ